MSAPDLLLQVRDLDVRFRLDRKSLPFRAVKGISFDVPRHSTVALVGESGSGKSVSAMAILGLLPENAIVAPESRITYFDASRGSAQGRNLLVAPAAEMQAIRGKDISVIFQEPMTSLNPVFTVGEQIAEVLRLHMGMGTRQAQARAVELLNEVGIPNPKLRVNSYPHEMSGGQQQRVMIAMAIACEPKLLIADEPTTALDVTIQKQILDLIAALQSKHHMSVLFITHDLGVVGDIADRVVVMQDGEIREQGDVEAIFREPKHPYTKALLACRPRLDRRPKRLPVIDDFLKGDGSVHLEERHRGTSAGDEIILEVKNLDKTFFLKEGLFGKRAVPAVKDVSFRLPKGKTLGLVGESGSGKTTVGLTVMRLHEATGGEVLFEGRNLLALTDKEMMAYRRRIQIIFQNPYASLNPRFTVGQVLLEPMRIHRIGRDDRERVDMALQLLRRVGLPEASFHKYPHEFSGGQRQRIAIARCLTMKPDVLICDESVSALDVSVQAQVLNLLAALQERLGPAYLFIAHDLSVVEHMSDRVAVMYLGRIVETGPTAQIIERPRHP
ncbi:MAG TPA: ABC transporter ATP-binding protein, partial [Usitatibacter sp.]